MTRQQLPRRTSRARGLRRELTDAEKVLWTRLRQDQLGCRFRRQHPAGSFVVDFVCLRHKYVVELDGSQHVDSPYDTARTRWLEGRGYTVVRFWNNEVLGNLDAVVETISGHSSELGPPGANANRGKGPGGGAVG